MTVGKGRMIPIGLGVLTLGLVCLLLVWDLVPRSFPGGAHAALGALPLGLIAFAYLAHQAVRRPTRTELIRAVIVAAAFLFWAANQLWPELPAATLFNDIAIALFVFDVFLVIVGWPPSVPDDGFAETSIADGKPSP
jgi:hypothetical protein